jgi:hypothetical protein
MKNNTQIKYLIISILIISFFISCASFSKKGFRKNLYSLEKENITALNGDYSLFPNRRYLKKSFANDTIPDSLIFFNAYHQITNQCIQPLLQIDYKNKQAYYIQIKIEDEKELHLKVVENLKPITDTTLYGRLKNGMFYLTNKELDCHGIPFFLGGCYHTKRRIGLTKKGNLLVNTAVSNEGAFLFIFGSGYSYNSAFEYSKN